MGYPEIRPRRLRRTPALRRLDNFEALAMLPGRGAAERTLLIASDNNFNARQVTAFLLLSLRR